MVAVVCDFIFIMPWSKPSTLEQFRVCTQIWAAGTSALNRSLFYLLPVPRESPAAAPRGGLCSRGAVCAASSSHSERKGNPRLGTNRSPTKRRWGVRWQLSGTHLWHDCPRALKLPNVFPALWGLGAPSPSHRSQGHLGRGALWGLRPTGSDSISSLSVV